MMKRDVDERVEAYLDGMLSVQATREFERDLAGQPELSRALSTALLVRDMLSTMPPERAPAGLTERIERVLEIDVSGREPAREPMWQRLRATVGMVALGLRGPALAIDGSRTAGASAMAGIAQMRWALGPLAHGSVRESGIGGREPAKQQRKPMWRRAIALVWRP